MIRLVFLLVALAVSSNALAQSRAGASVPTVAAEVEKIAEAARREGLTVIVMTPPAAAPPAAMMDTMRAERFLAVRARLAEILTSAATLPETMALTLGRIDAAARRVGEPFAHWWLLQGLATAAFGGFIGWLALRPVVRGVARNAIRWRESWAGTGEVHTTTERARALLIKTGFAVVFATGIYAVALLVSVVLDSGFEPTRRVIFECLTGFLAYRLLRFGFAWPLTAYDDPSFRLTGMDDDAARRVYNSFTLWTIVTIVPAVVLRFFIAEGPAPGTPDGSAYGALTVEHVSLLVIIGAFVVIGAVAAFTIANWRAMQSMFGARRAVGTAWERAARLFARAVPILVLAYSAFALGAFLLRIGGNGPAPGAVIVMPFVIGYAALVAYALALIAIQAFYARRERQWLAATRGERARRLQEAAVLRARLAEDEDMETPATQAVANGAGETDADPDGDRSPEFRPVMRGFLEQAALILIVTVALGELGRAWGIRVGEDGNAWAGFLDIVLAAALAWIAYRAITAAIDQRLEEEVGPEQDDDAPANEMGNEGGAGASRLATLLPILRWVLVAIVVVAAVIVVLSQFGVDIGPLLASAGVIGIAVGFGAQKLIQDVFSGAFFLLDDAFRRGEYIEVEGTKGTVEKISIRSFQLRHHLGALHTLPFGEIKQLTNYSRDWVLMKLPLRVTYDTDVEKVRKLIKKLGQQLLEHPEVGHTFMQPLKSQGVYRMEDSAMIIRVKFMTKPGEQFVTRKVVYAAIQELFARENIRFAHKEVTVRLAEGEGENLSAEQRKAVTAAAREVIDAEAAEEEALSGAR